MVLLLVAAGESALSEGVDGISWGMFRWRTKTTVWLSASCWQLKRGREIRWESN